MRDPKLEGIDLFVAPDRQKHGEEGPAATGPPPPEAGVAKRMREKLRSVKGQAVYKMRKDVGIRSLELPSPKPV